MRRFGTILAIFWTLILWTGVLRAGDITVASWNVQNLFDTRKDTDEPGEVVLNEQQLETKMTKVAEVIKYLKSEIIGLVEVENRALLRTLCREYLRGEGTDYFMLVEEADARGIDIALISKLPFTAYSFEVPGHTRGVLACRFAAAGEPFYVLVSHWKSRIGGGADIRMACANRTLELVNEVLPRYEGRPVPMLIIGDFNDEDGDESVLTLEQGGLTNTLKALPVAKRWTYPRWDSRKKEVHYQAFDHIFANQQMTDRQGIDLLPGSARVVRPGFMLRKRKLNGTKYDWVDDSFGQHIGYSDHLPVTIQLRVPDARPLSH